MINVNVLYPNSEGAKFDFDYYLAKHIPMVAAKLAPAMRGVSVEQGLAGGAPGSSAAYICICNLRFDSVDAFQAAFSPHAGEIMADVANYTNLSPTIQISEIRT